MFDSLVVYLPTADVSVNLLVPPLFAFAVSILASTAGVTGAFLVLPFQISVLGFTSPSVSATNLLYNVIASPGGIWRFRREGRLAVNLTALLLAGIIPGMLLGYYLRVTLLPDPRVFKLLVASVLGYVSWRLLRKASPQPSAARPAMAAPQSSGGPGNRFLWPRLTYAGEIYAFSGAGMTAVAFFVGIVGGAAGIGGGAIVAPLCVGVFGLPVHAIAGAVLLSTLVSSVTGVLFYALVPVNGVTAPPDWALGALFGLGGLAGTYLGARTQKYLPERLIRSLLAGVAGLLALRYVSEYFL